jgi:predicted phage baseplate assembly protein
VRDELLGTSDGTPDQRFQLAHAPLIVRSRGHGQTVNRDIVLYSDVGGVITEWTLQESMAFSREGQTDFAIEIDDQDRTTVLFGDGDFGAIPPVGAALRATYRVGGGEHGNVPAGAIQSIVDAPQLALLAAEITNESAATGGAERESIEHAVRHAPAVFRSLRRAVTARDYEALALEFPGVGKVRADAVNWNTIALYVAPEGGGQVSDVLRADLLAYFEGLRPLSTMLRIEDVDYVPIYVTADVEVISYYSRDRVEEEVRVAAGRLLAFDAVAFSQPLYLSKFYEAIEAIPGVDFVNISEFRRADAPVGSVEQSGRIAIGIDEIPVPATDTGYAGAVRVHANGGF